MPSLDKKDLEQIKEVVNESIDERVPGIVERVVEPYFTAIQQNFNSIDENFKHMDERFDKIETFGRFFDFAKCKKGRIKKLNN